MPTSTASDSALGQYRVDRWRNNESSTSADWVAEEVPVALVYNGMSHAVMLCSPQDLEDFARGFSLSECIIDSVDDIYDLQITHQQDGIQVELSIAQSRFWALKNHRRTLAGRTGCGLCGKESLAQLVCNLSPLDNPQPLSRSALQRGLEKIQSQQSLFNRTGTVHAAAWADANGNVAELCEDVGRHNALDKLIGRCAGQGLATDDGVLIMTSRASYEIVQKAATCGISMIAAVSGPTGMAIRLAERLGVTLIGFARNNNLCVYSHPQRLIC